MGPIFRDYGFVEGFPQKWIFREQEFAFTLDQNDDGVLELEWISDETDSEFFEDEIERLQELISGNLTLYNVGVSPYEQHTTIPRSSSSKCDLDTNVIWILAVPDSSPPNMHRIMSF
jgi:hypothetical protein